MRYQQTKEHSAQLIRQALPLMGRQHAAFHPLSYALWYEHAAQINPDLSRVLDQRLAMNSPLTEAEVRRLYSKHIAARDTEHFEGLHANLRMLIRDATQNAANAGAESRHLSHEVRGHTQRLTQPFDAAVLQQVTEALLGTAQRMESVSAGLASRLEASQHEMALLAERLKLAQSEALVDSLTGLKNRRGLERAFEQLRGESTPPASAGFLLADIDHFKEVNDTYGHLLGDKVIGFVADVLRSHIKGRDVAARMGGEEFAVLLPDTGLAGAVAVAEQIRVAVSRGRLLNAQGQQLSQVTLSLGVAVFQPNEPLESLIQRADAAMYVAKRSGRNRVSVEGQGS